ncbi:hypothetical protein PIB30_104039 [Stylosanthes scabra]|uniref:Kinesin motor domain-containing protein n=1 Tax=Stylosanthes scabra TaxID=79078 RepID=A0ABU6WWE4_9FABA|nr:hypothetical protein [Stylosanthes scabra]
MARTGGFFPLLFPRYPSWIYSKLSPHFLHLQSEGALTYDPHPNLRSPAVVFSVTASRGEGSLEYHQDPHLVGAVLGNSVVDPTLAVRVSWRRHGDVAAATTTLEVHVRRSIRRDAGHSSENGNHPHMVKSLKPPVLRKGKLVVDDLAGAENSAHVPFRDSKLTKLLCDSFGGNIKVIIRFLSA